MSWEVRGVALNSSGGGRSLLPPVPQLALAASIDYDAAGEWLYWLDSEAGSVWRVRRDGTRRELLLSQPAPLDAQPADWLAGLAVDWLNENVYWSEPRRRLVQVSRLDGTYRYVLLDTDPLSVTCECRYDIRSSKGPEIDNNHNGRFDSVSRGSPSRVVVHGRRGLGPARSTERHATRSNIQRHGRRRHRSRYEGTYFRVCRDSFCTH